MNWCREHTAGAYIAFFPIVPGDPMNAGAACISVFAPDMRTRLALQKLLEDNVAAGGIMECGFSGEDSDEDDDE
jgi:hypothetical protein